MHKFTPLMVAVLMAGSSAGALAATDLQKCGSTIGKAEVTAFNAMIREAARACSQGTAMNPGDVRFGAAAKMTGSFDTKVGQNVDKYSQTDCYRDIGDVSSPSVFNQAAGLADDCALVP